MPLLSVRRQYVLESLINEYVASAQPVGSKTLVARYLSDISSATVRNELSWLEDRGYVIAPHTSAGRIPTNSGYRSFVNHLLLKEVRFSDLVLRSAIKQLSQSVEQAYFDINAQRHSPSASQTQAHVRSKTQSFFGLTVTGILEKIAQTTESLAVFCNPTVSGTILHRGLSQLLKQPEFAATQSALPLIQLLENEGELISVLADVQDSHGLHIRIGTENDDPQLFSFSMIATCLDYGHALNATSVSVTSTSVSAAFSSSKQVLAVFGPTRMNYRRTIQALLQGAARITQLLLTNDKRGHFEY